MAGSVSGPGLPPIRLAAIADANLALAQDGARRYGYEKALPSWEAVAEDPSIDAVSIVVGNALHRPIAEALVAAGKHVLCEKPFAGSMEDARAMVELEKRGKGSHRDRLLLRRSPAIAAIRDHIRNNELGELTTLHARYWCDYACDPRGPLSWRFKGGMGSGALGDIGAHIIDQGEYLCGPIASVSGGNVSIQIAKRPLPLGAVVGHGAAPVSSEMARSRTRTPPPSPPVPSGLAATFSVSRTAFGMPNGLAFDIYGAGGPRSFDFHRPAEYKFDDAQPQARTAAPAADDRRPAAALLHGGDPMVAPGVGSGNKENFNYQARAFLDQVAGVTDPLPPNATFAEALHCMEFIHAVVRGPQRAAAPPSTSPPRPPDPRNH